MFLPVFLIGMMSLVVGFKKQHLIGTTVAAVMFAILAVFSNGTIELNGNMAIRNGFITLACTLFMIVSAAITVYGGLRYATK